MADPKLIDSPLSSTVRDGDHIMQICIYRLEIEPSWTLEVVAEDNTSTVWDDRFPSDEEALNEALRSIREEGFTSFLSRTVH
jgi:hypothetical protein